jgi:hypothetical protein
MSSLKDSIAPLEGDLKAVPPRIGVYHDLPFAIMRTTRPMNGSFGGRSSCWPLAYKLSAKRFTLS